MKKSFKVGDWVRVTGNRSSGGHRKGSIGVIARIVDDHNYIVTANSDRMWNYAKEITKVAAPKFIVAWSTEYIDPMAYAFSLAEAKKLNARKRVDGEKVVESRIFKAL